MLSLLLLIACIERVTDVAVPLDPAFYAGGGGAESPSGADGALGVPWDGAPGERSELTFQIISLLEATAQFDVVIPSASAAGGMKRIGRVETQETTVVLSVPIDVTMFTIEVFQDPAGDGPSADDPYATQTVDMAAALASGKPVPVNLAVGARPSPSQAGAGGGGGGEAAPWLGFVGETVTFTAEVLSDDDGEIQVDIAESDASAPGGQRRVGQVRLPESGAFTLEVPRSVKQFRIEAFQDRESDGPSTDDPYAELTTVVSTVTAEPVRITLVAGSRGAAGTGGPGPAGAGQPGPGGGSGQARLPWDGHSGATVLFSGTLVAPTVGGIQLDVNEPDAAAPGGQKRVGQLQLSGSGPFSFRVPTTVASFRIEAFQDPDRDGPSPNDPFAELTVTSATLTGAPILTLVAGRRGSPTQPPTQPQAAAPAGPVVKLSGSVDLPGAAVVKVDIFTPAPAAGKGRKHVGTVVAEAGLWAAQVTPGLGAVEIEAYQDLTGDGPTPEDPRANSTVDVVVGLVPVEGIRLIRY